MNLQTGAFGDPTQTDTLILFWTKMEELHYPGAGTTRKFLEERRKREQQAAMQQAMTTPRQSGQSVPQGVAGAVEQQAQRDAAQAVLGGQRPIG